MCRKETYHSLFLDKCEALWGQGNLAPNRYPGIFRLLSKNEIQNSVLVDFGCGTGGAIKQAAKYAKKCIGVDTNSTALARANIYISHANIHNVKFVLQPKTSESIVIKDDFADIVLSKDTIVHIKNKLGIFKNLYRICKSGGVIVMSDWYISSHAKKKSYIHKFLGNTELDFSITTLGDTVSLLSQSGFKIDSCRQNRDWYRKNAEIDILQIEKKSQKIDNIIGGRKRRKWIQARKLLLKALDDASFDPFVIRATKQ